MDLDLISRFILDSASEFLFWHCINSFSAAFPFPYYYTLEITDTTQMTNSNLRRCFLSSSACNQSSSHHCFILSFRFIARPLNNSRVSYSAFFMHRRTYLWGPDGTDSTSEHLGAPVIIYLPLSMFFLSHVSNTT